MTLLNYDDDDDDDNCDGVRKIIKFLIDRRRQSQSPLKHSIQMREREKSSIKTYFWHPIESCWNDPSNFYRLNMLTISWWWWWWWMHEWMDACVILRWIHPFMIWRWTRMCILWLRQQQQQQRGGLVWGDDNVVTVCVL